MSRALRLTAASLDDIAGAAGRAGVKAAGVVVDDAAVTPRYVQGLEPKRELSIIGRIARGSLRNKLLFILPAALLLSQFAPWLLTPILMLGGAYLCYEGAEKIWELLSGHHPASEETQESAAADPAAHEKKVVSGAVRTDFILSAEIMVISLNEVASEGFWSRAVILLVVALAITATGAAWQHALIGIDRHCGAAPPAECPTTSQDPMPRVSRNSMTNGAVSLPGA